jgi:hypothetical protein
MNAFGSSSPKKEISLDLKNATFSGPEISSLVRFSLTMDIKLKLNPKKKSKMVASRARAWSISSVASVKKLRVKTQSLSCSKEDQ